MDTAERWVALSDGGMGLEDSLRENFPRVEAIILDFSHVAEYLGKLAKALFPGGEDEARAWQQEWCRRLKAEGGGPVLSALRGLVLRGKPRAARAVHAEVVTYFSNQAHRMDYPSYVARGWQIGSGPVESACQAVGGQRLKGAGGCAGGRTGPMRSATCERCSEVPMGSGRRSGVGTDSLTAHLHDAHPSRATGQRAGKLLVTTGVGRV
jgi:hypothetical protein